MCATKYEQAKLRSHFNDGYYDGLTREQQAQAHPKEQLDGSLYGTSNFVASWQRWCCKRGRLANLGAHQNDNRLRFEKPLFLAVLTIEGEAVAETKQQLRVKLGVFCRHIPRKRLLATW
eukprot:scaffold9289_cov260-Amphora_coffeaeformis.AAC.1